MNNSDDKCMCGVCIEERAEQERGESEPDYEPKNLALAAHLSVDPSTITEESSDCSSWDDLYSSHEAPGEYRVMTDAEADAAWDESLENYIDECILPELPEAHRSYFDYEAWKRDARYDGRGHCLSSYDGCEYEEQIDGEWYYIYRVN
jgi:hypothetical protein